MTSSLVGNAGNHEMRRHIALSSAACDDLASIWDYIGIQGGNPDAADHVLRSIHDALDTTARLPNRGVACPPPNGVRRIHASGHTVYYRPIHDHTVQILRVLNDRRDREAELQKWL